jgi:hypothetical protein
MNFSLSQLNQRLKSEADAILKEKGLRTVLDSFGTPHLSGSYALDLMTWRDLDIYLEIRDISEKDFFLLGGQIASLLSPVKMSFRNERISKTEGLPNGLYWGIYLGNERTGDWKIDIWAVNTPECQRLIKYCTDIKEKLTPASRQAILDIKSKCWQHPEYRRSFSSMDIYTSVLEKGITDINEFMASLRMPVVMK